MRYERWWAIDMPTRPRVWVRAWDSTEAFRVFSDWCCAYIRPDDERIRFDLPGDITDPLPPPEGQG